MVNFSGDGSKYFANWVQALPALEGKVPWGLGSRALDVYGVFRVF